MNTIRFINNSVLLLAMTACFTLLSMLILCAAPITYLLTSQVFLETRAQACERVKQGSAIREQLKTRYINRYWI